MVYTDKTLYGQELGTIDDSVHMTVKIVNQGDTTVTLIWNSSCQYRFYIDGVDLNFFRACGHVELYVDVPPQDSLVWNYRYPDSLSPKIYSGSHSVVGEVIGYGRDTVFIEVESTLGFTVREKWNIISIPTSLAEYRKTVWFPLATSDAFSYDSQYVAYDTLENGVGYWMHFPDPAVITLGGAVRTEDTIDVREGWNLIGSLSDPVSIAGIGSIPGGMTTSGFYTFHGGYTAVSTLMPGMGYWVKVSEAGQLILSGAGNIHPGNRIRIINTGETPPVPDHR